jgi:hypothetical protein
MTCLFVHLILKTGEEGEESRRRKGEKGRRRRNEKGHTDDDK